MTVGTAPGPGRALPWPLPALLAWSASWAAWAFTGLAAGVLAAAHAAPLALLAGTAAGTWVALRGRHGRWRQAIAAAGFPLSALLAGTSGAWPAWAWLVLLLPPLWLYPMRAWRDAPFFPSPVDALEGVPARLGATPARVLDAGCGLGHGLAALHRAWPRAHVEGIEWSRPLAWLAAMRCRRWARVRRGDMWAVAWSGHDVVYVFQRPESMARVHAKACAELAPGSWLLSLEFAVPGVPAFDVLRSPERRPLWLYRIGPTQAEGDEGGGSVAAASAGCGAPPARADARQRRKHRSTDPSVRR